jgi:hypothetical protein
MNAPEVKVYNRSIQIGRGDSFVVTLPSTWNITGYTFAATIKTKDLTTTIASYTVSVDTGAKTATFTLAHGVTSGIDKGSYVYDVKMTPATGSPRTLFRGAVNVSNPVTA